MRSKLNISFIALLVLLQLNQPCFAQDKKILFLGNSYTAANDLPMLVAELAKSLGDSIYYDSNTPGGYRLMNHATNTTTLSKINSEDWDFVVLQGQSQEAADDPATLENEVFPYASILNDSIKSNNPCTETVFYMTWGRKYGDQQNCEDWPPVCTFLGMQERLMVGYMLMTEYNNATVAPVGLAWKQVMDFDPDSLINLYSVDNSHPSSAGSYLTACVMYATMFHKSPEGSLFYGGLPEAHAIYLQQMAAAVVLGDEYSFTFYDPYFEINFDLNWLDWFENGSIVLTDFFIATTNGVDYIFTSQNINASDFFWDFGDGYTSTLENPQHTYQNSGQYIIDFTAFNSCFSDIATDTINVVISDIQQSIESDQISIYQNTGSRNLYILLNSEKSNQKIKLEVIDNRGVIVLTDYFTGNEANNSIQISMPSCMPGIYYMRLLVDDSLISKKFILK